MRHLDRPTGREASGLLDRTMPGWLCALILVGIGIIPVWFVAAHYSSGHGFTKLILFGTDDQAVELPEVKAQHPATIPGAGYDGQYYAQLAMDPTMRRPDLRVAVAQINYRSQRYLPILLAYLFGFGRPGAILTAYVLLHLAFWLGLVALMAAYLRGRTARQYACLAAAALTTGALICLERSLGDLPAATLALASALADGVAAVVLISLATLCKGTFVMALARYAWPLPANTRAFLQRAGLVFLALAAPVALYIYLRWTLGPLPGPDRNTGWPFVEWARTETTNWHKLMAEPFKLMFFGISMWEWRIFELLAPVSLLVQAVHFVIWREPRSALWWLGATFAFLFVCLGHPVTVEEIASARTVLPMTLAFNLRLAAQSGGVFWAYFVAGNFGLLWCWHDMLSWINP